jgi:hypothetical protein
MTSNLYEAASEHITCTNIDNKLIIRQILVIQN